LYAMWRTGRRSLTRSRPCSFTRSPSLMPEPMRAGSRSGDDLEDGRMWGVTRVNDKGSCQGVTIPLRWIPSWYRRE
jgi:hypothetical protein